MQAWARQVFVVQGTVLPRLAGRLVLVVAIDAALLLLYRAFGFTFHLEALPHSLLGVALGMLLVFRTNASYDRFWEGRKSWGAIVNASRNLVRAAAATGDAEPLARLVSGFAVALKQQLRGAVDRDELIGHVDPDVVDEALATANPALHLALHMSRFVRRREAEGGIDGLTVRTLEGHVTSLIDAQGACERILKTPLPFAYVAQIRQLLAVYLLTLPGVLVPVAGWWSIAAVLFIAFGLLGIDEAGAEIEDPFGTDPNDLPLDALCATIARNARELAAAR